MYFVRYTLLHSLRTGQSPSNFLNLISLSTRIAVTMAFRCFFLTVPPKNVVWYSQEFVLIISILKKNRLVKDVFCSHPWPFFHIRAPENPVFFCYFLPGSRCHYLSKWWFPRFGWWLTLRKKNMVKLINHRQPSYSRMVGQGFSEVEQLSPEKWWHLKEADPASQFWMIYFATGRAVKLRSMQYSFDDFRRLVARRARDRLFFSLRNGSTGMNSWWGIHPVNQRDTLMRWILLEGSSRSFVYWTCI